ncbi:MAG: SGNH/GDSL hydrolase family protein [Alphaproteobacteria bacterium]|nr:SGNH/GDSL hydrolase family protein [Alphaproteobacteria bacterium]
MVELVSRVVWPISPGAQRLTLDGDPVSAISSSPYHLRPNLVYRQVSSEFDAVTTITPFGHRIPHVTGNPEIVFLGDSFTFGDGLADEETFVSIYCSRERLSCANLGRGGTGTGEQLDILEYFLGRLGWRPQEVKLFMLAMSGALMAGNDFLDNLNYEMRGMEMKAGLTSSASFGFWRSLLDLRRTLLRYSNLARLVYFHFGPSMRTALSPKPRQGTLKKALEATRRQLNRLEELSEEYGFSYQIYVLHPVQDILRETHIATVAAIRNLAPRARVTGTAQLFEHQPAKFYYPYDGHLNARGSRRVAELLLSAHNQ